MLKAFIVTGRVQGVGFRWFTRQTASELGLRGTVRNARDGSVEVVADGTRVLSNVVASQVLVHAALQDAVERLAAVMAALGRITFGSHSLIGLFQRERAPVAMERVEFV